MPNIQELAPLVSKTYPFFLLVQFSADPDRRRKTREVLGAYLRLLQVSFHQNPNLPLFLGIYPFGSGCCGEPLFLQDLSAFDPEAPEGHREVSFPQVMQLLNSHLSRHTKLQFPAGCYTPTILLFADPSVEEELAAALAQVQSNNWFRSSRRLLISFGPCREATAAFPSDRKLVLQLPQSGDFPEGLFQNPFWVFSLPRDTQSGSLPFPRDPGLVQVDPVCDPDDPEDTLYGEIMPCVDPLGEGFPPDGPDWL